MASTSCRQLVTKQGPAISALDSQASSLIADVSLSKRTRRNILRFIEAESHGGQLLTIRTARKGAQYVKGVAFMYGPETSPHCPMTGALPFYIKARQGLGRVLHKQRISGQGHFGLRGFYMPNVNMELAITVQSPSPSAGQRE